MLAACAPLAWMSIAQGSSALQPPADDAAALLARGEELACDGRYADAIRTYERLVEEHPGTAAAHLAEPRIAPSALLGSCELLVHGPSANRVDVVILGDGYELDHQRAFDKLAADVPPIFERVEPFREYWSYFNFHRGVCVSAEAGVDGFGRVYDTLLGGQTLGTEAGHVGVDGEAVHRVLRQIPESDGLALVFVKLGILGTGSRGTGVIGGRDASTAVHEWGHAFGGLSDEYATHTHDRGAPREGINVSVTEDEERVPWRHWLEARHPSVGTYEGANGQAQDAWRPTASGCVMNDGEFFCPVCREALVLAIYALVDPIESTEPPAPPPGVREPLQMSDTSTEIRVRTMRPARHDLEVLWWVDSAAKLPVSGSPGAPQPAPNAGARTRLQRGPLRAIEAPPTERQRTGKDGECSLKLSREDLEPGLYRITCRVRDTTELRGERFPWVLRDEHGLLESERVWWLEVR